MKGALEHTESHGSRRGVYLGRRGRNVKGNEQQHTHTRLFLFDPLRTKMAISDWLASSKSTTLVKLRVYWLPQSQGAHNNNMQ